MNGRSPPGHLAIALYWLAQWGGFLAFVPLFALLLPRRVLAVDPLHATSLLSQVLLAGAICAGLANIVAGRITDFWVARHANRRIPLVVGAAGTALALAAMGWARTPGALILAMVTFQAILNLLLASLTAMLADHVPNHAKGEVSGWLGMAFPAAGLGTVALAHWFPADGAGGFAALGAMVALACLPLGLFWRFGTVLAADRHDVEVSGSAARRPRLAPLAAARFLIQMVSTFVFQYLYLYLSGVWPLESGGLALAGLIGRITIFATAATLVCVPLLGRRTDRLGERRWPMAAAALGIAVAVIGLGYGRTAFALSLCYSAFQLSIAAYLAIEAALVGEIVHGHHRRGEMLGFMNLANTLPGVLVPILLTSGKAGQLLVPWSTCFMAASVLAATAALFVIRSSPASVASE